MPIPPELVKTPEIVWATLDDTVDQVRERLESSRIKNKYRAFVIARSVDSRFAASSVSDIQPIVWREGPPALELRLRDLGLFHLHEGVEEDSIDGLEAQDLAGEYGGYLVVLRGSGYAGIVKGPGTTSPDDQPLDAFDLFDEPFPKSLLTSVEFVTAAPDTTVSEIAQALKDLDDPENAFIVLRMADGSYRVILTEDLNNEIAEADPSMWSSSVDEYPLLLRTATSRESETVGRDQALKLAEDHNFLVLTHESKIIGLLPSSTTLRLDEYWEEVPLDPQVVQSYDLFDVPVSYLELLNEPEQPKTKPRFVNLWFKDSDKEVMDRAEALVLGQDYYLALNVGHLLEHSIIDWERTPSGPLDTAQPQEIITPQEETYLYLSIVSQDFDVPQPTVPLWLPKEEDTQTVNILVQPLRRSAGAAMAKLEVCLYYRAYLVQMFEVYAKVVSSGEKTRGHQPQYAELTHARTASFPDMQQLAPHHLSLTINRDGPNRYRFTFLVDPNPEDRAAAQRSVKLSCLIHLTRDDLTHLITKARRQLYNVVQTFDLLQAQDEQTFRKATRALAQVGRQLYLRLFESKSAQVLEKWMAQSLPEGSIIQIVDLAGDFVFPWSLVYADQPWDDDKPVDIEQFWGWRYQLVILTDRMLDTYRQSKTEIATDEPLRVSVGMFERLVGVAKQKAFFKALSEQSHQRIEPEILTNRRKMSQALADADRDTYYFYCHGYTERIATDIQLNADLVGHFARTAAEGLAKKSESIREHLVDLFDVSDSWLRLTRGKIPLTMLKEMVPQEFSRHPIVFLNMCESAQVLPSLSDGFVPFFIQRGARAVIGTECSMNTIFADDFARGFMTCLFHGESAGEILWALRRYYLDQGNPLALAYTLYSDADLRLNEGVLPSQPSDVLPSCKVEAYRITTERREKMSQDARWDAVEVLWDDDMDGLMMTLASRAQAEEQGLAEDELLLWDPPEEAFATDREAGPEWTATMKALGARWWEKLEPKLFDLLCKEGPERDDLLDALKEGGKILAVALAPILVAQVAALPAVAIVIATIAAKKIADAGLEAVCEMWKESLEEVEEEEPS